METGSNITAAGFLFLLVMAVMMWTVKRKFALVPLLITTCYMPLGQVLLIGGLHFQLFRILLLVGALRVVVRSESKGLQLSRFDRIFLAWAGVMLVMGFMKGQLTTRAGEAYDALGAYFLFRCWLRTPDDLIGVLRFLGWMIVPLAVSMFIERFTSRNVFYVFGGVPLISVERDGGLRCQGAFRHPILAGTYAATLFPGFVGLWAQGRKQKWPAIAGIASATFVTAASHSSGSLLAWLCALIGLVLWRYRARMRLLRWAMVAGILGFAAVMNAPVWYIIARVSDLVGGTGWHRSYLIDQAVKHFNEWWLIGSKVTAHWAPGGSQVLAVDPNNMDITNHYISQGLAGGVLQLGLFVALIVLGFKTIGRRVHLRRVPWNIRFLVWSLGAILTAHCVSFFSVSYFDQIVVMWYWLLAVLSMLAGERVWINYMQPEAPPTSPPAVLRRRPVTV